MEIDDLKEYLNRFSHLHTDVNHYSWTPATKYRAPHKPFLLLSVLDLFAQGLIHSNLIEITPELSDLFVKYWSIVMPLERHGDLELPFFHLQSSGFWHLIPIPGKEKVLQTTYRLDSFSQLKNMILGASLNAKLYYLLQSASHRYALRETLVKTYFTTEYHSILLGQRNLNILSPRKTSDLQPIKKEINEPEIEPFDLLKAINTYGLQNISIEALGLSNRLRHLLLRNKITSVAELINHFDSLHIIPGMGTTFIQEAKHKIQDLIRKVENNEYSLIDKLNDTIESSWLEHFPIGIDPKVLGLKELFLSNLSRKTLNLAGIYNLYDLAINMVRINNGLITDLNIDMRREILDKFELWLQNEHTKRTQVVDSIKPSPKFTALENPVNSDIIEPLIAENKFIYALGIRNMEDLESKFDVILESDQVPNSVKRALIRKYLKCFESRNLSQIGVIQLKDEQPISVQDSLETLFSSLTPRNLNVLTEMYGLYAGQRKTAREVSANLGLSTPRIQQMRAKGLMLIKRNVHYLQPFFNIIKLIIRDHGGIISHEHLVSELSNTFVKEGLKPNSLLELFRDLELSEKNSEIIYIHFVSGWISTDYPHDLVGIVVQAIREILEDPCIPLQWSEIYSNLTKRERLFTLDENFALSIAICAKEAGLFKQETNGAWSLPLVHIKKNPRILQALRQIGKPAHYSEITKIYNMLYPDDQLKEYRIYQIILKSPTIFIRIGRGTFGLPEWGIHDDGNLANAVFRILSSNKKPMTIDEITAEVLQTWKVSSGSIISTINKDHRLSRQDNGKIWIAETSYVRQKSHKPLDETRCSRLLTIMRSLNRPEHIDFITEEYNKTFATQSLTRSAIYQSMISAPKYFVRIERNIFGLKEWELLSEKINQQYCIDQLVKILRISESPMTYQELTKEFNKLSQNWQLSPQLIFMILSKNPGTFLRLYTEIFCLTESKLEPLKENLQGNKSTRRERILYTLQQLGKPTHYKEITNAHNRYFSKTKMSQENVAFTLSKNKDIFCRLTPGVFGLTGWLNKNT